MRGPYSGLVPYMRAAKTTSGATAVQAVGSSRRASRAIERLGSAHDEAELETLKAAARQRVAVGPSRTASPSPPRVRQLADALERAYQVLELEDAAGRDEAFQHLVLARIIEPTSKLDSPRV